MTMLLKQWKINNLQKDQGFPINAVGELPKIARDGIGLY